MRCVADIFKFGNLAAQLIAAGEDVGERLAFGAAARGSLRGKDERRAVELVLRQDY